MFDGYSLTVVVATIGFLAVKRLGRIEKALDNLSAEVKTMTGSIKKNGTPVS
jgi:hypothetical protein